jgi:hypothetical protein
VNVSEADELKSSDEEAGDARGRRQLWVSTELYFQETLLGSGPRLERAAGVSFGKLMLHRLPLDSLGPLARTRADYGSVSIYGLLMPFDLEDLPSGRRYLEAMISIAFDDPRVIQLRSVLEFRDVADPGDGGDGSATVVPDWDGPPPSAFGLGRPLLRWKLTPKTGTSLLPGSRVMSGVIQCPTGATTLAGTMSAEAVVARPVLGIVESKTAYLKAPLRFRIGLGDGAFELDQDAP